MFAGGEEADDVGKGAAGDQWEADAGGGVGFDSFRQHFGVGEFQGADNVFQERNPFLAWFSQGDGKLWQRAFDRQTGEPCAAADIQQPAICGLGAEDGEQSQRVEEMGLD